MKFQSSAWLTAGAVALTMAACGGSGVVDDSLPQPTTTEAAPTTSRALQTTTTAGSTATSAHMDMGSDDTMHDDDTAVPDVTIDVIMSEFEFEPSSFTVMAGQTVMFSIINEGAIEHEFRLSNEHRIEEHIEAGHVDHNDEEGGHHEGGDIVVLLQAGESEDVIVTFSEDTTVYTAVACLLPGHYEAGMRADLTYNDG